MGTEKNVVQPVSVGVNVFSTHNVVSTLTHVLTEKLIATNEVALNLFSTKKPVLWATNVILLLSNSVNPVSSLPPRWVTSLTRLLLKINVLWLVVVSVKQQLMQEQLWVFWAP